MPEVNFATQGVFEIKVINFIQPSKCYVFLKAALNVTQIKNTGEFYVYSKRICDATES